jgi:hypothetical protein
MLLDPDPHPYTASGSGSRTAKSMRTRIRNDNTACKNRVLRDALKELEHIDSSLANVPKAGVQIFWKSSRSCKFYVTVPKTERSQMVHLRMGEIRIRPKKVYLINPNKSKEVIFKVFYKTIWSRGWSRSRNSDLRLRVAGAERNIFGSATQVNITSVGKK